jgi:multiple sugar transport system permease protein
MQQRSILPFALVSPVQLMVGGIIFLPALYVLWLSLHQSSFGQAASFVGLANYAKVLGDPYFWRALVNTVIVVAIVVHVELLLGLLMALFFAAGIPFRALMLAIVLAPYAVSEVSAVVMWRYLFEPDVGMMSQLLGAVGLPPIEWSVNPSHGLLMVCLLSIWLHLPFSFIILYAARLSIPGELYEAAAIDGATGWAAFRRVTLPLLMPALLIAALFRYIFAFRLFSEAWLLTKGGPARSTEVVAIYLYQEAFSFNAFGPAAATAWIMVLVSLLLAGAYVLLLRRGGMAHAH